MIAALAAGGTLLAVMIAISAYGAVTLPATARIPLHWGGGWGTYVGKRAGLIVWPAVGALVYGVIAGLGAPGWPNGNQEGWQPGAFMLVIMVLLAAFQAGAIAVARRTAAARGAAGGAAGPGPADPMTR